jgi:hypothetical protein
LTNDLPNQKIQKDPTVEYEEAGLTALCCERDHIIVGFQLLQRKDPGIIWMPESKDVLPIEMKDTEQSLFKGCRAEGKRELYQPNKAAVLY